MHLKALVLPVAALLPLLACSSKSEGVCQTLVLDTTSDIQMAIDAAPTASVPFANWEGSLQMDGLPPGVGFEGKKFAGTPTQTGTFAVKAHSTTSSCASNVVSFNVVVSDRPAECASTSDCGCVVSDATLDTDGVACTTSKDCASTAHPTCAQLAIGTKVCCGDDSVSSTSCGGSVVNVTEKSVEGATYDVCGDPKALCNERQHCVVQSPGGP